LFQQQRLQQPQVLRVLQAQLLQQLQPLHCQIAQATPTVVPKIG
jgi:hypothetical protein